MDRFSSIYSSRWLKACSQFFIVLMTINSLISLQAEVVPSGMLPKNVTPLHYNLQLDLNPAIETFTGKVNIDIMLNKTVNSFFMHGTDLTISEANLDNHPVTISKTNVEGVLKVQLPKKFNKGKYRLSVTYSASFNTSLLGIYRVKEGDKYFIYSQMESIYARNGFPSFDEPRFKTTFDIEITIPKQLSAISNAPEKKSKQKDESLIVTFATTKPIPTYLFAVAVGDFDVVEWKNLPTNSVRDFEIPLRGIAVKGKGEQLSYALEHTAEIVYALEDYFQIPYPYAKLDIIAVPDFAAGAMENAGAITYREQLLLFGEDASIRQKRAYKSVHAHELAHQWFGNLVTPVWWNDIWLNEAFATWIAGTALHRHFPEEQWKRGLSQSAQSAMISDSIPSARKIRNPIKTNGDIITAFDGITYSKGAGVLSMFEAALGEDLFQQGVHDYLIKHSWGNADALDFIRAISSAADSEKTALINKAFRGFIEQVGVPQLDITAECEDDITKVSVSQSRYQPLGTEFKNKSSWQVPTCISYEIDGILNQQCNLISQNQQQFKLDAKGCTAYIMPNANASGYYRFNLDKQGWTNLLSNLDKLSAIEANATLDSFNAAYLAGSIKLKDYLAILPKTLNAKSWEVNVKGLDDLNKLISFADADEKNELRKMAGKIYQNAAAEMGFTANTKMDEDAPRDAAELRRRLLTFMAASVKDPVYREYFNKAGKAYIGYGDDLKIHPDAISNDLVATALSIAVDEGKLPYAKALLEVALASTDDTFHGRAYSALASTDDSEVAKFLLPHILNKEIKDNRVTTLVFALFTEEKIDAVAWPWLKENFDAMVARFPKNYQAYLPYLFSGHCNEESLQRLANFLEPKLNDYLPAKSNYQKARESIAQCIAQKKNFKPQISQLVKQL